MKLPYTDNLDCLLNILSWFIRLYMISSIIALRSFFEDLTINLISEKCLSFNLGYWKIKLASIDILDRVLTISSSFFRFYLYSSVIVLR